MAKDLPYFKFFCSEWNDGDIALEDLAVQGLFINLCSYYWSNECNVTLTKCKKKFKTASDADFDCLLDANIIKVDSEDNLLINFLIEQFYSNEETVKLRSKAGKASAEARKAKALSLLNKDLTHVEQVIKSCSTETQLLREEEIKEEKRKEDKTEKKETPKVVLNYLFMDSRIEELWSKWKTYKQVEKKQKYKAIETEQQALKGLFEKSNGNYEVAESIVNFSIENLYSGLFVQKSTQVNLKTEQPKQTKLDKLLSLAEQQQQKIAEKYRLLKEQENG